VNIRERQEVTTLAITIAAYAVMCHCLLALFRFTDEDDE